MMGLELYLDLFSQPCRAVYLFAKKNDIPFEFKHVELFKGVLIPLFTGQPLPSEKLQEVMEGLAASVKQLEETFLQDKPFLVGSEISLADLMAIVELMQPVGVGCDVFEGRPRLAAWRSRVEEAIGKELFLQAHELILNIEALSSVQIDPRLKEQLAPVLLKMLK
ncbi:glutathione S-transferase theta-1-like isoform X4 [Tiliqua scincoides]|uniref:glutathione S-transferase theta-1-like isoform X4 n=1 Tax=Tiliqua scincoides TaxID=71010 RepID=UPI0034625932